MADKYIDISYNDSPGSVAASTVTAAITAATAANPVVVTSAAHGFSNGDIVAIDGVVGMVEINDRTFTVASAAANTFALTSENGTGHTAYTSGGVATKLQGSTGDVRVIYDDTLPKNRIVDALQRAKEVLTELQ